MTLMLPLVEGTNLHLREILSIGLPLHILVSSLVWNFPVELVAMSCSDRVG